jgi:8-oxo-dGDP phosphatase
VSGSGFETLEVAERYRGYSSVRVETVRTPHGEEVEREVVGHDDAVAVVPITEDGQLVLLRQYRQPLREHLLEIPAGKLDDDGESPEEAARRELAEETGYEAGALDHLVTFDNSAGWTDERTHVFLARAVVPGQVPEGFEAEHEEADMEVVHVDLDEMIEAARRGEVTDAKTLVGLLLTATRR